MWLCGDILNSGWGNLGVVALGCNKTAQLMLLMFGAVRVQKDGDATIFLLVIIPVKKWQDEDEEKFVTMKSAVANNYTSP
jgi:hypothetical protein